MAANDLAPNGDPGWIGKLHLGRLARLREQLIRYDCAAGLFYDPINIRYATGTTNMQVYSLHNPCRYAFVATDGPVVLFEFKGCEHLAERHPAVDEVRRAVSWYHFAAGPRAREYASQWCEEVAGLLRQHGGGSKRLAIDRLDPIGTHLLEDKGIEIVEGQEVAHMARMIKTPEEIAAIRKSVEICQTGIRRMRDATAPGMTEQEIWSILHQANIENGGEWIETRLLTSGPRTNPWYQEASDREVKPGDMISLDSDLVGPSGYSADVSRSWTVGDGNPSAEQRELYALAHEQVSRNLEIFKPGRSFLEIAEEAWRLPERYAAYEQPAIAHGIGLCNEYPLVFHKRWVAESGHDGIVETGMVLCVESYVGATDTREGVKLEQQILITQDGCELLSDLEFETELLRC